MSYPVDAFSPVSLRDAAPGTLAYVQRAWVFKLTPNVHGHQQMLYLTGDDAGGICEAPSAMALAVKDPNAWAIFIETLELDRDLEARPAVSIGNGGPIIHGHVWQQPSYGKAATKDGQRVDPYEHTYHFVSGFTIWLVDAHGNKISQAPLLTR